MAPEHRLRAAGRAAGRRRARASRERSRAGARLNPRPVLVLVSGPPRSGKTTLARAIAEAIPCPAICRDEIKEGMVHAHGSGFEAAVGDPLTQRTLPLFFDVLRVLLAGGVTLVAEAAFQDALWRHGLEPLDDLADFRIVQTHVEAPVAWERYRAVARRPAHGRIIGDERDDWERAYASFERLSLDVPSVDVDTTNGYEPALAEIVDFVSRR